MQDAGITPTSMMDISDGLSSEMLHICKQSHVGCRIYEERLPIDYQTAVQAEEFNMNVTTAAMNGGEDYELLFTVPLEQHELIQQISGVRLVGVTTAAMNGGEDYELLFTVPLEQHELIQQISGVRLVGHITEEKLGCAMITRDGNSEVTLRAQGWNAFVD